MSESSKPSADDMRFYYEHFLPFRQVFQWLSHSPKPTKDFTLREFAYEHHNDIYQRYISYTGAEDFKRHVCENNPKRFEIGAVFLINPRDRKTVPKTMMKPQSKELVFDIDLTDYDDIRTCCQDKDICAKCWKFITVGARVLDAALRDDFGFKHLIWVFSGRRGAHCWVSDARARALDDLARKAVVDYLDVLTQRSNKKALNLRRPLHPHIERSLELMKNDFVEIILHEQDPWLTTPETQPSDKLWQQTEELLAFVQDKDLQAELRAKWQGVHLSSRAKWDDLTAVGKKVLKSQGQLNQLQEAKKDVIIYYLYPKLDVAVSKLMNHLLKSPFCVHPATGNICVPFDPQHDVTGRTDEPFNPAHAPNVRQVITELENTTVAEAVPDYDKTSMKPFVLYFAGFVAEVVRDDLKGTAKRARDDEGLEF